LAMPLLAVRDPAVYIRYIVPDVTNSMWNVENVLVNSRTPLTVKIGYIERKFYYD
jgi:hypothetical protein